MKPARATMSAECASIRRASSASNASRVANARCSTTSVAMPCSRANARPAASPRLLSTAAMRAFQRSLAQARTIASMFEPRPEMRMTMFFIGGRSVSAAIGRKPTISAFCRPRADERSSRPAERRRRARALRRRRPAAAPAGPLRHAPDRRDAHRSLPRRAQELGPPAGPVRVLLLRRRLARADDALRRARGDRDLDLRDGDRLARRRHRPRQGDALHPEPPARARRAVHAAGDGNAAQLARAHADLQGPDRKAQGARPRDLRLPRLPAAAGGRHPDLPGGVRPGRRRPGAARRDHARGRAPLQPSLRPRARLRGACPRRGEEAGQGPGARVRGGAPRLPGKRRRGGARARPGDRRRRRRAQRRAIASISRAICAAAARRSWSSPRCCSPKPRSWSASTARR